MTNKAFFLEDRLSEYIVSTSLRETPEQRELRERTMEMPNAQMQSAPDQVQLLALLAKAIGARRYLEVGVFTGYSALGIALALPVDGRVVACDVSKEYTDIARPYWKRAGVDAKIDLRLAPATETLDTLLENGAENSFDLAYIDADKPGYDAYYERALRLVRRNGLIALDNVLWSGEVADPSNDDPNTAALRNLNEKIGRDERVDQIIVTIGDGLTIARKR
ncbi:MAG: class I SAM-dependent methyltransferase [Candidatus Eremiobacteraeota bacterium]|nr:class I SAM-dependent methyltransferase [Candidatus Eremiobacteraeota bacterium]